MLENITKVITRFLGIIAGSLSGISAILIAIGYLAERSHLKMLGFTTIPVDLNQYLYTGAKLLGFLPGLIIIQTISILLEPLALVLLSVILLIWILIRFKKLKEIWSKILIRIIQSLTNFKVLFLSFFVFIQIFSLYWMNISINIENLLFKENVSTYQQEFSFFTANTTAIAQLLLSRNTDILSRYFTQLFLITFFIGISLRYVISFKNENQPQKTFKFKFWLTINLLLFTTHIILLPGNYGVLLLNNKYQEVEVQFKETEKMSPSNAGIFSALNVNQTENTNKMGFQHLESEYFNFKNNKTASLKIYADIKDNQNIYSRFTNKPKLLNAVNETEHYLEWPKDARLLLLYQSNNIFYLYSKMDRRIWYVRSEDIEKMVYYGRAQVF